MKNLFLISASKREKGVSILLAILILGILLAIALGTSRFIVEQTKMMREVGYSVKAFYAADSGIEEALYTGQISPPGSVNGATYTITCECCDPGTNPTTCLNPPNCPAGCHLDTDGNCQAPNFCLKSIGTVRDTRQAIQIDY